MKTIEKAKFIPLMKILSEKLEKKINKRLKKYGMTFSQTRAIMLIRVNSDTGCTMKDLEKAMDVTQQTAAGIVRRLEQKKLVTTWTGETDKRVKFIRLTDKGLEYADQIQTEMLDLESEVEKGFSGDELNQVTGVLEKILQTVG